MHRITGDGYITQSGKRLFADEDLPSRYATQVTHQWANTVQEELATIVEDAGGTLNADAETVAQMNQVNTAIKNRIAAEASARSIADAALSAQIAGLVGTFYPGFNHGLSLGNTVYDDYIQCLAGGLAVDSAGAVLMTVANQAGSGTTMKRLGNYSGYVKGYQGCGVPQGVTLVNGTNLHIFLLHFASGADDIGVDTDITAVNLRADPACLATHYRRISFCRIASMAGSVANTVRFGHGPNGFYRPNGPLIYSKASSSLFAYWGPSELCLPENVTGVDIVYTVLPPTGTNAKVVVMPRGNHNPSYMTSRGMWQAELAAGPVYRGESNLRFSYWGGSSNAGVFGVPDVDCTVNWALEGFWDDRNRNG